MIEEKLKQLSTLDKVVLYLPEHLEWLKDQMHLDGECFSFVVAAFESRSMSPVFDETSIGHII